MPSIRALQEVACRRRLDAPLVRVRPVQCYLSPQIASLIPRLSPPKGRREPGNIGGRGVKPWTPTARIMAEPIRLHDVPEVNSLTLPMLPGSLLPFGGENESLGTRLPDSPFLQV